MNLKRKVVQSLGLAEDVALPWTDPMFPTWFKENDTWLEQVEVDGGRKKVETLYDVLGPHFDQDSENDMDAPHLIPICLLYTSPSPRDRTRSRMPSSA